MNVCKQFKLQTLLPRLTSPEDRSSATGTLRDLTHCLHFDLTMRETELCEYTVSLLVESKAGQFMSIKLPCSS